MSASLVVHLSSISAPESPLRRAIEAPGLEELTLSIRQLGLLNPLTVKKSSVGFEVVAGHRRLLACRMAPLEMVPVNVVEVDQVTAAAVKLAENERWPSFKVSPYVQQQRAETKETQFGIGVSIPLPLFDRNKGNIATAKARQTQAEMMLAAQMRELERAVASHRSEYALYVEELAKWPADTLDSFQKAAAEADEHYRLGALPLSTYIELQQQSIEAMNAVLDSQLGALQARMGIEQLTGISLNK